MFCGEKNMINVFWRQDSENSSVFDEIECFIKGIQKKFMINYSHEYLGSVLACVESGMLIKGL